MGKKKLFSVIGKIAKTETENLTTEKVISFLLLGKFARENFSNSRLSGKERVAFDEEFFRAENNVKNFIIINSGNNTGDNLKQMVIDLGGGIFFNIFDALPFSNFFLELLEKNVAFQNMFFYNAGRVFDATQYFVEFDINPVDLFEDPTIVKWAIIPAIFNGDDYASALKKAGGENLEVLLVLKRYALQTITYILGDNLIGGSERTQRAALKDNKEKALKNLVQFVVSIFDSIGGGDSFSPEEIKGLDRAAQITGVELPPNIFSAVLNKDFYYGFKVAVGKFDA